MSTYNLAAPSVLVTALSWRRCDVMRRVNPNLKLRSVLIAT